ncbi:hypothetical protein YPPY12_1492, partial [Yersinia pestis PY-12]
MAAGG